MFSGTELTEEQPKQKSPEAAKPEIQAVAQQVAQVNIGITPADNPQQVMLVLYKYSMNVHVPCIGFYQSFC